MGLGNNRDYKTADRRARTGLAKHKELMDRFIAEGHSREEASKLAMRVMEGLDLPKITVFHATENQK